MISADTSNVSSALSALTSEAQSAHSQRFGCPASCVVASPGRVNLIGEHIDYNDGFVMPMAIERYVIITASACDDAIAHFVSGNASGSLSIDLANPPNKASGGWASYLEGVIHGFSEKHPDAEIPGFHATVTSNVPIGSGLSSSAALEVATATLLEAWAGRQMTPVEKVLLCQKAEHDFAGVPCGIMDQFISVHARANELMLLDCLSLEFRRVPLVGDEVTVLIVNSNVDHELAGGEYAVRRNECDEAWMQVRRNGARSWREVTLLELDRLRDQLGDIPYRRARHIVTEIARTMQAVELFRGNRWTEVGQLMNDSHQSLRDDFQVSCDELDTLVEIMEGIGVNGGVFGCRMTGGGFGGCTVALVQTDCVESVREQILDAYHERTGIQGEAFSSQPASGTHVIVSKG